MGQHGGQLRRFGVGFRGGELLALSTARSKSFGKPSCGMAGASLRTDFALLCLGEGVLIFTVVWERRLKH